MNEDNSPYYNFNYYDWVLIRIIGEYYPDLKDKKKELSLLARVAWTLKDFNWHVALAEEVQARMIVNRSLQEPDGYKLVHAAPPENLLSLDEYKDILFHLISTKVLQLKIILSGC